MVLYVRNFCGFCRWVQNVIAKMGLDIEQRNIWQNRDYERELLEATGRSTVPVLRVIDKGERSQWIPESVEIIRYLQNQQR